MTGSHFDPLLAARRPARSVTVMWMSFGTRRLLGRVQGPGFRVQGSGRGIVGAGGGPATPLEAAATPALAAGGAMMAARAVTVDACGLSSPFAESHDPTVFRSSARLLGSAVRQSSLP